MLRFKFKQTHKSIPRLALALPLVRLAKIHKKLFLNIFGTGLSTLKYHDQLRFADIFHNTSLQIDGVSLL